MVSFTSFQAGSSGSCIYILKPLQMQQQMRPVCRQQAAQIAMLASEAGYGNTESWLTASYNNNDGAMDTRCW